MKDAMQELKPCPFCCGDAELDTRQGYTYVKHGQPRHGTRIIVYCLGCGADIGVCREDDPDIEPEAVIDMWNRRALPDYLTGPVPTHRCKVCGALWRLLPKRDTGNDDAWNMRSATAGQCCDNATMGEQIEPLTWEMLKTAPAKT